MDEKKDEKWPPSSFDQSWDNLNPFLEDEEENRAEDEAVRPNIWRILPSSEKRID